MRARLTVAVLVAAVAGYAGLVAAKGVVLARSGSAVGVALGVALLVVPLLGAFLVWREVQFGRRSARLAQVLVEEGGLPVDDLPRRPSGRVERAAADAAFGRRKAEVEADPLDWRGWYRLALAYDDAGDRGRARAAVRRAIDLFRRTP